MSKLLFPCSSCSSKLAVDGNLGGTAFTCPTCQKPGTIPHPSITFSCQSCNQPLSAASNAGGDVFQCPYCSANATVPSLTQSSPAPAPQTLSSLKPLKAKAVDHEPHDNSSSPGQNLNKPASLLPVSDITKTGQPQGQPAPVEPSPGLRFKATQFPDSSLNPALARLQMPVRSPFQGLHSFLKVAGIVLAVACLAAGAMCFMDLGRPDVANWTTAVQALNTLKSKPTDEAALSSLKEVITRVRKNNSSATARAGLTAVWALGQINIGKTRDGLNACKWLQENYAGTRFAGMVAISNLGQTCNSCKGATAVCPACKGTGTCLSCFGKSNSSSCPKCKGTSTIPCPACNGKGKKVFTSALRSTAQKSGRLGQDSSKPIEGPCTACNGKGTRKCPVCTGAKTICPSCHNTRKCSTCKGSGRAPIQCAQCNGLGCSIDMDSLGKQYAKVINKALQSARNRLGIEKFINLVFQVQKTITGTKPGSEPQSSEESQNNPFTANAAVTTLDHRLSQS